MSTAAQISTDNFTDAAAPIARRKRRQTPYKARLATSVKNTLEDSVKATIEAQEIMKKILAWTETQRTLSDDLRTDIGELAPLDHRMQMLLRRNTDLLLRVGELDNHIGKLALLISDMERELTSTLINSRLTVAPPTELGNGKGA